MAFFKKVNAEEMRQGVKVQFVGVYALQWPASKPTDGFVEAEDRELIRYLLDKGVIVTVPQGARKFKEVKVE